MVTVCCFFCFFVFYQHDPHSQGATQNGVVHMPDWFSFCYFCDRLFFREAACANAGVKKAIIPKIVMHILSQTFLNYCNIILKPLLVQCVIVGNIGEVMSSF